MRSAADHRVKIQGRRERRGPAVRGDRRILDADPRDRLPRPFRVYWFTKTAFPVTYFAGKTTGASVES